MSTVTTLSDELDKLRNNICHGCKERLLPGTGGISIPTHQNASGFQGPQHGPAPCDASNSSPMAKVTNNVSPIISETIHHTTTDTPAMNSGSEHNPDPKSELPEFSVVYNPEVKRVLDLHLMHVFTHESAAYCMKMSPDGQRIAVGFLDDGKTIISEVKTRSNIRSVFECLFRNLG